jgi:hypothetical protein
MTDGQDEDRAPFSAFLVAHDSGEANTTATAALADVVKAVKDTGLKGTVTLTVTVAKFNKTDQSPLVVTVNTVAKVPVEKRAGAIWYADDNGGLQKTPANQMTMFDEPVRSFDPRKDQE